MNTFSKKTRTISSKKLTELFPKIFSIKRAQVTIFIIVALFLVGSIALISWLRAENTSPVVEIECDTPDDCVPNECCDAKLCVPKTASPRCEGVICQPGCYSEVNGEFKLGCGVGTAGEGSCSCVSNKCVPVFP